jgi:hypothetical protein
LAFCCHVGNANSWLTPPPLPLHATSLEMADPVNSKVVPPQASTNGLDAGKSTWSPPSFMPSLEPSSPDAAVIVMPSEAASWNAAFMASRV